MSRGSPRRSRTAKARRINGTAAKSSRACETDGWGRSKRGWRETAQLAPEPRTPGVERRMSLAQQRAQRPGRWDSEPTRCRGRRVREGGDKQVKLRAYVGSRLQLAGLSG